MSRFLLSLVFIFPVFSSAAPMKMFGVFRSSGQIQPRMRLTIDSVDLRWPDGDVRLQTLRAEGANCQALNSWLFRCVKQIAASEIPASSLEKILLRNRDFRVEFGVIQGTPKLLSQAPQLIQWEVPQPIRWNGGSSEFYRYYEMPNGLHKIEVPGSPKLWLNLAAPNSFVLRYDDSITFSSWPSQFHQDSAEVILVR